MIDLWLADLAGPTEHLEGWLSADERARRDRFAFPELRKRFARGRGLLRLVLADYLDQAPGRLEFGYGPQGKPTLAGLHFNLSHAGDCWLLAVSRDAVLGVDIEHKRPLGDLDGMMRTAFSPTERAGIRALPAHEREEAFYRVWTRKEAYMKATGKGFSLTSTRFELTIGPEPPRLVACASDPEAAARWGLADVEAPEGYAAAIAVAGHDWQLAPVRRPTEFR
jgi:4'-phosphopantetheinyl transferase